MTVTLKPLSDQVMVITGASSGIGLATARRAAAAGAAVVLAARNSEALDEAVVAIRNKGGRATSLALDVADEGSAERLADHAIAQFGRIDCWVNDAAAAMYARLEQISLEEHRRVFDVGYFGLVQGSLVAIRHLRAGGGGALINLGSVLSNRAIPLQGPYCAMKAAVMQFTDALRMELEEEGAPISVTLIKPAAIDTPYPEHARNKLDRPARLPQPIYDVKLVAKAICFAAEHRRRTLIVGGGGVALVLAPAIPRLADKGMELIGDEAMQTTDIAPAPGTTDNLFEHRADGRTESNQFPYTRQTSLYLEAQMHPLATAAILGGIAAAAGAFFFARRGPGDVGTRDAQRRIAAAGMFAE